MSSTKAALLKTVIFTILGPGFVTVAVPYLLLAPRPDFELGGFGLTGVFLIVLGAACYFRCAWDFASVGRGTPAPVDPPKQLVVKGVYRFVRNPMYIGVGLVLGGEAILFQSLRLVAYALLAWLACHLFVVFYEELTLRKKFGTAYEAYCRAVPRWVPRFTKREGSS